MAKVKSITFHSPFFLAGKNFGLNISTAKTTNAYITYDKKQDKFHVEYLGEVKHLSSTAVADWQCFDPKEMGYELQGPASTAKPVTTHVHHAQDINKFKTAQVSGPHDHVFAGPGAGKTKEKTQ